MIKFTCFWNYLSNTSETPPFMKVVGNGSMILYTNANRDLAW